MKPNWPTKKLGEIRKEIKKEKAPIGAMPYIEIGNVNIESKKVNFTKKGAVKGSVFCPEESILISRVRPTRGAVVLANKKYAVSSAFTIIQPKINPRLLFYFLAWNKKFFEYLKNLQKGTSYPSVRESDILDFEVSFPEGKVEQKKIVYVLDSIQEAVRAQERIIEKTKELKKAILNEIFNSKIKNQKSKLKFKIQRWVKLKEVSEILMGQSPASSYYNISKIGLPFLQGKAEFGEIYPRVTKWCCEPIKIAEKGDILISVRAPVGDVNLADQKYCIGRGLATIRSKSNLNNIYLFNYLQISKEEIKNEGTGSTFKAINKNVLENFLIPLPSLSEQREIAEILQTIDQKIEIEQKKKALYEELFKTMLNKLMNGEIKVDNLRI